MTYQVDQSGKIEDTAKDTVLAYSNEIQHSILIPRKVKRQLQEAFRRCGMTRMFVYSLFSVGIFYLIKDLKVATHIVVDIEYPGKETVIIQLVSNILKASNKPSHQLVFERIGNRPRVHYAAKNVLDKKSKPNYIVRLPEVITAIKKADGRLRECFSTLVDAQPRPVRSNISRSRKKSTIR